MDRTAPLTSASGKPLTILEEAAAAGHRVGLVNTGHIGEPGTAVFVSRSESRRDVASIAAQVMESGADLIFCGGEVFLLPEGTVGVHGVAGVRSDGRNLIEEAREIGYEVIFTREELLELDPRTPKVIGIFAALNTYNDKTETALAEAGLPLYDPAAPTFAEMVRVALRLLGTDPNRPFFLVAEEEGIDNFSNVMNAAGMLEAIGRADAAIGEVMRFIDTDPVQPCLLMVAADSDAGHPALWVPRDAGEGFRLPETSESGAQLDGLSGEGGVPFISWPDAFGNRHPFGIAWATAGDFQGSMVARAHGYRSDLLGTDIDNSGLFGIFQQVLFGRE